MTSSPTPTGPLSEGFLSLYGLDDLIKQLLNTPHGLKPYGVLRRSSCPCPRFRGYSTTSHILQVGPPVLQNPLITQIQWEPALWFVKCFMPAPSLCTPGFKLWPALYSCSFFWITGSSPLCLLAQEICSWDTFNVSGMGLSADVWALN